MISVTYVLEQLLPISPVYTTGGGQGVGEASSSECSGNIPPTRALPRQGGGDYLLRPQRLTGFLVNSLSEKT